MTFADLRSGSNVFLDANIFVFGLSDHPQFGPPSKTLLDRIARQDVAGFTSTHVLSEAVHRLMTLEAITQFGWPQAGIGNRLRQNPLEVQKLSGFKQVVTQATSVGVRVLAIPTGMLDVATTICQQVGMLINDALVVAAMQQHGLTELASGDSDFDRVPGMTRYAPI